MNRPYIICQMITSIDGKIRGNFLERQDLYPLSAYLYGKIDDYKPDAVVAGRVSLDGWLASTGPIDLTAFDGTELTRDDFIANADAGYYLIAIDPKGKLPWKTNITSEEMGASGNAHVVEVLSENVDNAYLAYLQSIGVSYIFAGTDSLSLTAAAEKLYKLFGIKKMIVEGGSIVNGSFAYEGLIDELSIIIAPIAECSEDNSSLFGKSPSLAGNISPMMFSLETVERMEPDIVWMNYKKKEWL